MTGKLIVIEGLDGTGKKTQTELLLKRLKKEGFSTVTFDFPQYHKFFGKLIGTYLRGEFGQANEVSPSFASMLYALDRWSIREKIQEALNDGKIVLANRYSTANFLHQTGKIKDNNKKAKFLKWLEYLEFDFLKIPRPDLVFFLDLPYSFGQRLIKKKSNRKYLRGKKYDIHEKSDDHLKDAEGEAKQLIKKFGWQRINCLKNNKILTRQEVADKVWLEITKLLIHTNDMNT